MLFRKMAAEFLNVPDREREGKRINGGEAVRVDLAAPREGETGLRFGRGIVCRRPFRW